MTEMKMNNHRCLSHAGPFPEERNPAGGRLIDAHTTQAFQQLQLHAEDLTLELAVRLRVLGKCLVMACPGLVAVVERKLGGAVAYENLRRQLEGFLGSLVDLELAGHHCFPVVRNYLQESLPLELGDCVGAAPCRIELVETIVSLLSGHSCENSAFQETRRSRILFDV
jgi:hypothetical protein